MSLRKLKDGRWRFRFFENGMKSGQRKQVTLSKEKTRAEAKDIYLQTLAKAQARNGSRSKTITFAELASEYMDETTGPKLAEKSRERHEEILRIHLLPVFGHMVVPSIKAADVEHWRATRLEKAAPATVNREWNAFRAILNFGDARELIERNPIRRGAVKPYETTGRTEFFEPDEWQRFLAAFDDENAWKEHLSQRRDETVVRFTAGGHPTGKGSRRADSAATLAYLARLRAMVPIYRAMFYTASRIGEVLSLTWSAVDLKRGTITITQHKTKRKVSAPKTLPMCAPLRALLQSLPAGVGDVLIFRKADGSPFTYMEVARAFARAVSLSGGDAALTPHSVRHTVGSWLTIAGHSERHIAEILGHAQRTITSRYAHLRKSALVPVLADLCRIEADGFRDSEVSEMGGEGK